MAEKTTTAKQKTVDNATVEKKYDLEKRVSVKNLANWTVTFARKGENQGDVLIAKDGRAILTRNEIQAQIDSGNKLFIGEDGHGSHATIYIEDAATRKWVGFEDENHKQMILTDDVVLKLFDMSNPEYESNIPVYVKTRAEKYALIETIRRLDLNDYRKIVFAEKYTGFKVQ